MAYGSEGEDDASLPVKKRRIKEELVSEVNRSYNRQTVQSSKKIHGVRADCRRAERFDFNCGTKFPRRLDGIYRLGLKSNYRVTHQVVLEVLLTSKQKFIFCYKQSILKCNFNFDVDKT